MMNAIDLPPSLNQLKQLASIGAARPRKAAYGEPMDVQVKYYAVDKLDSIVVRGEDDNLESVRHSVGVRMGRRAVDGVLDICRLEYHDSYRVERDTNQRIKAVTKYEFEWSEEEVLIARRSTSLTTDQDRLRSSDIGDDVLRFHVRDDAAAILDAEMKVEQVTRDDCTQLIADTTAYYAQVAAVNKQSIR